MTQNFGKNLTIADYILMLKCCKNYIINVYQYVTDKEENDIFISRTQEICQLAIHLFDDHVLKFIQSGKESKSNQMTVFNLLLDILYQMNEIDLGLQYFTQAQSMNIYSTLKHFNPNKSGISISSIAISANSILLIHRIQSGSSWSDNMSSSVCSDTLSQIIEGNI